MLPRLLLALAIVLFSVSVSAFEIADQGADFSIANKINAQVYFENEGEQLVGIQFNNTFSYSNEFVKQHNNNYKWDIVFDRTGRNEIKKIVIIFFDTTVSGNTVTRDNFLINFEDAIQEGFTVVVQQVGNDSKVSLSSFDHIDGVVRIDPTIIDTSQTGITNYGNTIVRDSSGNIWIVYEAVSTPADTDIFVSKSTDDGVTFTAFNITSTTDFNEHRPHIDINSTDGLVILYDKQIAAVATSEVFVTTCSSGGCDGAGDFLTDFNISQCGLAVECAFNSLQVDQNDIAHTIYKGGGTAKYRQETSYVGTDWNAEVNSNANTGSPTVATGILVAKNGSTRKLAWTNPNGAQLAFSYFNGIIWSPNFEFVSTSINTPSSGVAGYDGNFYVAFSRGNGSNNPPKNIHLASCAVVNDCNVAGNWTDVNVNESPNQNDWYVSIMQGSDLNLYLLSSARPDDADANIHLYTRLPNGVFTTSSLADANLLFNDSNKLYNPLFRNRDFDGSAKGLNDLPTLGNAELDYTFLTTALTTGDPSTLLFDSNFYALANGITAAFTTNPVSPVSFDVEAGITNVQVDFNSTTLFFGIGIVDVNYQWSVDSNVISTDQNTVWDLNQGNRDFNVTLIAKANDGVLTFTSQSDQNILLRSNAQGLDINVVFNATANLLDVNYGVTADGSTSTINYAVWGFPNDQNLLGLQVVQQYRAGDTRQVCVVANTTGDVNKLRCETFFNTHLLVKIPKNITGLATTTPFDSSIDTVPSQSRTAVSVDQNYWFLYQTNPDTNTFNLIVDANVSFFLSNYFVGINAIDLNQSIQPYMVGVTDGINVIFTAQDSLTNDTVQGVVLSFGRTVSTDGDVEVQSGITDDLGRITMPFIAGIDHNFTLEFPFGTVLKTGTYVPQTIDATDGIAAIVPSVSGLGDVNAIGVVDINYLQSQVDPQSPVDLNVIIKSTRDMNSITVTVDHNGVQQATDSNSFMVNSFAQFNFHVETDGLSSQFPFIITVDVNFTDGGTFQSTKAVTISRTAFDLFESFGTAKTNDLGGVGGTMLLSAFVITLLLGLLHFSLPNVDNSHSFVIAAVVLLFLSFVGWVDGVSWVVASIAGGAIYFLRRVDA